MKNNRTLGLAILSLLLFIGNAPLAAKVKNYTLSSPDGGLKVEISTGDGLSYRIMHENDTILSHSNIGLVLADGTLVGKSSRVTREEGKDRGQGRIAVLPLQGVRCSLQRTGLEAARRIRRDFPGLQ